MANRSEAYDFSYFEDISSSGAAVEDYGYQGYAEPYEEPQQQPEEQPGKKPVELPRKRESREAKPKLWRNAVQMAKYMIVIGLVMGVSIAALCSEVQLTELNEKISDTKSQLEEAESLEVQLTMQAAQRMTDAQVEQYAIEELGMGKLSSSQVVYLHVAQQDKGTVVQENTGGTWLQRTWAAIRSWFV